MYIYTRTYTYTYTYAYIHTCMHTYIHTYIHTHIHLRKQPRPAMLQPKSLSAPLTSCSARSSSHASSSTECFLANAGSYPKRPLFDCIS